MPNTSKALSQKELDEIESMAGLGMRYDDIAQIKGMSDDTLKKYANDYLQRGKAKAKAQVMQTAYKMAVSGKVPSMTMFWLKTQCRWQENHALHIEKAESEKAKLTDTISEKQSGTNSAQVIAQHLAETIQKVEHGELDPKAASSIASVANSLMKALSQGELEERLTSLEAVMKSSESPSLELDI